MVTFFTVRLLESNLKKLPRELLKSEFSISTSPYSTKKSICGELLNFESLIKTPGELLIENVALSPVQLVTVTLFVM